MLDEPRVKPQFAGRVTLNQPSIQIGTGLALKRAEPQCELSTFVRLIQLLTGGHPAGLDRTRLADTPPSSRRIRSTRRQCNCLLAVDSKVLLSTSGTIGADAPRSRHFRALGPVEVLEY